MNLTERLTAALAKGAGSHMILLTGDQHDGDLTAADTLLPAAVLIAVTDRADPGVILTQRTDTMSRHPGQIAFPGGRIDPGEDVVTAALREAEEEIALPRDKVRVIGEADSYRTVTGFQVTPVIGIIPPDMVFTPSEAEVASVFEVPLAFLLDEANHVEATLEWQGHDRHYYEIMWNERRIWGATAAMIVNLARRLRWS
ncbi:NUDIX domain-containing protein [Sphingomonas sp. PP-CE-1A-559]|jgi:8-oxo-dGTP pyrophosphatase MutT (NUDIX family)|uniref:CoA pyrophosphatase n=1 Tax=Sphingomonas sp. PP-CE-1A-559 TaxID=2135657 RepID=UPI0010565F64|nr:CoA pyrophosphatase [Sphingomonas sp. PP-CE-1A-559]TCP92629.1 NUDIX domain-containing protein [Sphingomonas sp. PP-CE-1A-559]